MTRAAPIDRLLRPIDRFMQVQASGGILLFAATIVALVWANSPWRDAYHHLFEHSLAISLDDFELRRTLHHWINDGLMALFFFVVGLELKREIVGGQLSQPSQAVLPVAAGIGGMLAPAAIYAFFNLDANAGEATAGWGIPMATDIAFAVGVLALLGSRVPASLKVFLTTLAIADDLGAVVVIALFYTSDVSLVNLVIGMGFLTVLIGGNRLGIRSPVFYGLFGIGGLWLAFLLSGVHATIAGVLAAMTIPASVKIDEDRYIAHMREQLDEFARLAPNGVATLTEEQLHTIDETSRLVRQASTPLQILEHQLHPLVVYLVLPVFALANAGVELPTGIASALAAPVSLGVGAGLLFGKPIGILLVCGLTVRLGWARLPDDLRWVQVAGVACLAGIGFTMSLFINELAFASAELRQQAKLGILVASVVAGAVGYAVLRSASGSAER